MTVIHETKTHRYYSNSIVDPIVNRSTIIKNSPNQINYCKNHYNTYFALNNIKGLNHIDAVKTFYYGRSFSFKEKTIANGKIKILYVLKKLV